MVCETKINTLDYLKKKEVLGKFNDILNPASFEKYNKELTRYAELKYNLDFEDELLFSSYTTEKTDPRTSTYWRDNVSKTIWASPNDEMFKVIDEERIKQDAKDELGELPDPSFKRGRFETNEVNKLFSNELKLKLVTFLGGLGITTDTSADKLLNGLNFRKGNPIAAFDLIQKFLALKSDITDKSLLNQSAYIIYSFLGRGSKTSLDLWFNIKNWNKYDETYEKWDKISEDFRDDAAFKTEFNNEVLFLDEDINKNELDWNRKNSTINFWAHRQSIIEFISEMLEVGLNQKFIGEKKGNPDINKAYFESIGHKDKYADGWLIKIINKLYNWLQENIFNNKAFNTYDSAALEDLMSDVVDDVYQLKYEKFIRNYILSEEDGNWYDMKGQLYEAKDYEKSIAADPFVADVIEKLFGHPFIDYALSGSATLRKYGRVLRSVDEDFHDIDGVIKLSQFQKEDNSKKFLNWIDKRGLPLSQRKGVSQKQQKKNFKAFTNEITPLLEGQSWYANMQRMFPSFKLLRTFIGKGELREGESIVITGTIEHPTDTELVTKDNLNGRPAKDIGKVKTKLYLLDFFLRTKPGSYPMQYEGEAKWYKEWKQIFEAKISMGRGKDLTDLIYFKPLVADQYNYKFRNRGYRYFSFTNESQNNLTVDLTDPFENEVTLIASNPEGLVDVNVIYKNNRVVGKIKYTIDKENVEVLEIDSKNSKDSISALKVLGIDALAQGKMLKSSLKDDNALFKILEKEGYAAKNNGNYYFVDAQTAQAIKNYVKEVPVNLKAQEKIHGIEIAKLLSKKLALSTNLQYANITQASAKKLLNSKGKPYNNEPAFYFAGTIYTVGDNINLDTVLHEFGHPFIKAIEVENTNLFNNLYETLKATTEGEFIINHVKQNYPELNITSSAFKNEVLTYSLQIKAVNQVTNELESKGFQEFIKKLIYAIRQLLRKVFKTSNVADINESTTMKELADKLLNEAYDLNIKKVTDDDVLFYARNIKEMAIDLTKNINDNNIQRGINELYVVNNLVLNKAFNYKAQSEKFQKRLDDTLFDEGKLLPKVKTILRSYQTINDNATKDEIIKDVVKAEKARQLDLLNSSRAFINSVGVIDNISKNIYKDLDALRKTKSFGTRDAVLLLYTYRNTINGYATMFDQFDEFFTEDQGQDKPKYDIDKDNDLFNLINDVKSNLQKANNIIKNIYKENSVDFYVETTAYMNEFLVKELKSSLFNSMNKKMKDSDIEDFFNKALNGELTNDDYNALEKKGIKSKYISDFVKKYNDFNINRDKIVDALSGKLKDVSFFNRFLESYTSSNDPIVGGLSIFIQNLRTEAEQAALSASYEFRNTMADLLPKVGFNKIKTRQILDMVATKDAIFSLKPIKDAAGNILRLEPERKELFTFHDKFGNGWRHDLGKLEYDVKKAIENEDEDDIIKTKQALYDFTREFMHDVYIPEVYELDKVYAKYPPEIANAARQARKRALDTYNNEANEITDELEQFQKYSTLQALWKDYQMLHSYTYADGKPKVDSPKDGVYDFSIAQILNEYRDASKEYYEFTPRENSLQNAYDNFINLIDSEYGSDSDKFINAKNEWLKQNTRIAQTQEYFDLKVKLTGDLKRLQEKIKTNSKIDISEVFEEMYSMLYGTKDSLNQPVPSELGVEKIRKIKILEQKTIDYKNSLDKTSGLTKDESGRLSAIIAVMKKNKQALTEDNKTEYVRLLEKQTATGLSLEEANELNSIYAELGALSNKVATEYYIDAFNAYLNEMSESSQTPEQLEDFLSTDKLKELIRDNDEFGDWFFDNHVINQGYEKGKRGLQNFYKKSIVNIISLPSNEEYYQTTELVDPLTNEKFVVKINDIPVIGNARHSNYRIKAQYMTGYNPNTGDVELVIGEHVNNKNQFLPRYIEGSKYINKEFQKMQNAPSTNRFKLLEAMKKQHLKTQENASNSSKLYLDLPRYVLRDNLSVIQSGKLGNQSSQIKENFLQYFRDLTGSKDKSIDDYNFAYDDTTQEYRLVQTTLEGEEIEKIPISGLFDINIENTDPDVLQNMMKYLYSIEQQNKLGETLPLVKSLLETLDDPDNALKKTNVYSKGAMMTSGKLESVKSKSTYNRLGQVRSLIEREYYGRKFEGGAGMETLDRILGRIQKLSARSSLAVNLPSDLKNRFGQLMQNYIEAAGGEFINSKDYARGRVRAFAAMTQWLAKDVYSIGPGSLDSQMIEIFDSVFATKDKFGKSITKHLSKDLLNGEWMYAARKTLEMEAALQLYYAFMNSVIIEQKLKNGKIRKVRYIDAWELNKKTGIIQLKEGINPEYNNKKIEHKFVEGETLEEIADYYGTTVDKIKNHNKISSTIEIDNGDVITIANSAKFKSSKNRFQGSQRKLYGAYDEFGQSEGNKFAGFRLFTFMRKWFFPMFHNRLAFTYDKSQGKNIFSAERYQPRYDFAMGTTSIGYYINTYKAFHMILKSKGEAWNYLTLQQKTDSKKSIMEGMIIALSSLISIFAFGYDPDDEDRFKKMKKRSGILGSKDFKLMGYITNMAQLLNIGTQQEVTAFIPLQQIGVTNFGLDDYGKLATSTTTAFGNTIMLYAKIMEDVGKHLTGNEKAYYSKNVGDIWWKQKGQPKIIGHLLKTIGITGGTADIPTTLKGIEQSGKLK